MIDVRKEIEQFGLEMSVVNAILSSNKTKTYMPRNHLIEVFKRLKPKILYEALKRNINIFAEYPDVEIINIIDSEFKYFVEVLKYNKKELRYDQLKEVFEESVFNTIVKRKLVSRSYSYPRNHYIINTLEIAHYSLRLIVSELNKKFEVNEAYDVILALFNRASELILSISNLLSNGLAKDALILWRSLHEVQCNLIIFAECSSDVIESYIESKLYEWVDIAKSEMEVNDAQKTFINGVQKLANRTEYKDIHKEASTFVHPTINTIRNYDSKELEKHIVRLVFNSIYDIFGVMIELIQFMDQELKEKTKISTENMMKYLSKDRDRLKDILKHNE